jgi:hypothetical protein
MSAEDDLEAQPKLTYQIVPIPSRCRWFECEKRPTHAVVMASHVIPEAPVVPGVWFFCDAHAHPHVVAEQLPEYVDLDAWQDTEARELFEDGEGDDREETK